MATLCNITYPTAKNDINILVQNGILEHFPGVEVRPIFYIAPEIMKVAYGDSGE
jgi:hypothetical protein